MSIDLLVAADIIQKNGNTEMNETITRKMYEGISLFCIDAVSYTHLDVYKRQLKNLPIIGLSAPQMRTFLAKR